MLRDNGSGNAGRVWRKRKCDGHKWGYSRDQHDNTGQHGFDRERCVGQWNRLLDRTDHDGFHRSALGNDE